MLTQGLLAAELDFVIDVFIVDVLNFGLPMG
jgi:hypothetical protein